MDAAAAERFAEWAQTRSPALHRLAYLLCGDWHVAEDVVQEALARAALKWPRVEQLENPDAYVRRILINQLNTLRRRKSWRASVVVTTSEMAVADTSVEHARNDELMTALRLLPPRQRAVITLRYFEDLPEQEVAGILGCSIGTVKSQAHKALQSLRRTMAREELPC
jgi:RNA polymerase sigma-70 factor (sigma-E family)